MRNTEASHSHSMYIVHNCHVYIYKFTNCEKGLEFAPFDYNII